MPGIPYSPSKRATIAEAALHTPFRLVAARFGCSISTVSRLVQQRQNTGSSHTPPRPGRPSTFSPRTLAQIRRILLKNRRLGLRHIIPLLHSHQIVLSLSTLRRILKVLKLRRQIARVKPFLNSRTRSLRYKYAVKYRYDGVQDWRRTIYVDEAAIRLNGSLKTWVTRGAKEAYLEDCMVPKLLSGKDSIMVWAAVWHGGRSELVRFDCSESQGKKKGVTGAIYRDQIIKQPLKHCWNRVNNRWRGYGGARIVEDNARIHTSATARHTAVRMGFKFMDHPPSSPDLNPIENCWALLKQKLAALPHWPTTRTGMFEAAYLEWQAMPQAVIDNTVDSMARRLKMVRKSRGFATKY